MFMQRYGDRMQNDKSAFGYMYRYVHAVDLCVCMQSIQTIEYDVQTLSWFANV